MDLKLTTSNPANMTDTNKLLYFIYGELVMIRRTLFKDEIDPLQGESDATKPVNRLEQEHSAESRTEPNGLTCKYCGELVKGNRGNLLAHIRKCDKRASKKEVK